MTLADEAYESLPVNTFITHGQALTIAWRLGHVDDRDTADHHPDHLYLGDRLSTDLTTLRYRSGLRWYDFWATHDPAPAGGFATGAPRDRARGHRRPVHARVPQDEHPQRPRRLLGERRGLPPADGMLDRHLGGGLPRGAPGSFRAEAQVDPAN